MPRKKPDPSFRLHKPTGQAVVTIRLLDGRRRDVYLGRYDDPESKRKYHQVLAEAVQTSAPSGTRPKDTPKRLDPAFTVDQLIQAFWDHAQRYYRDRQGNPTTEVPEIKRSLATVRDVCDDNFPACEFGPLKLAEVQNRMIANGWCRKLINRRVDRVRRAFKWAASVELIPVAVYQALATLTGLKKGRTEARESEEVKPVDRATVTGTLPFLSRHVRAMVELQQRTGMRPGEVCGLSFEQIDRTAELWVYRPSQHKTAHRGKDRVIPIGPRAQALLLSFLVGDNPPPAGFETIDLTDETARLNAASAYREAGRTHDAELLSELTRPIISLPGCIVDPTENVFSPAREREERYAAMRKARKSPVQPSQVNRRKVKPKRVPAATYEATAYTGAIARAAEKAKVPHWHPNQLRHSFATEVRKRFGFEAAGASLGHSKMSATEVYAERDFSLATQVAQTIG